MPHSAVSDLGLYYLPRSLKKDAMLIWVKYKFTLAVHMYLYLRKWTVKIYEKIIKMNKGSSTQIKKKNLQINRMFSAIRNK